MRKKNITLLILAFICLFSFLSCNQSLPKDVTDPETLGSAKENDFASPSNISECITEDGYLVLPISECRVFVLENYKTELEKVDIALLKAAEETITGKMSAYTDNFVFYLEMNNGYLRLCVEAIIDIDPPNVKTGENGEIIDSGCDIDHKHIFFGERITK